MKYVVTIEVLKGENPVASLSGGQAEGQAVQTLVGGKDE